MTYEYSQGQLKKCEQNFKKIGTNLISELYLQETTDKNLKIKFTFTAYCCDKPYTHEEWETLPSSYGKIHKIKSGYQHYILQTQDGKIYRFGRSEWETPPISIKYFFYQDLQVNYFQSHGLLVKKIYCGFYTSYFLCSNNDLYYCGNVNFQTTKREIAKDVYLIKDKLFQSYKQYVLLRKSNSISRKLNIVLCEQDVKQCWVNQFSPNFFFVKSLSDDKNLYAMGNNQSYQLAIGGAQIQDLIKYEPVKVPRIDSNDIVDLALSSSYSSIILKKKSQAKHRVFLAGFEKKFFSTFREVKELTEKKIVKIVSSTNLSLAKSRNNDFWIFGNDIIEEIPNSNYLAQKKYRFKNIHRFEFNKYPIHFDFKISPSVTNKFFFYLKSYKDKDLIDDLLKLLISGLCADLTICDGIKVHKIFVEARLKCKSETIIDKLKKYKKQTIRNFLKYVYTGKIFNEKYYPSIMRILKKFKLSDLSIKSLKRDLVSLYYDESSIDFNILIKNEINPNNKTETKKKNLNNKKKKKKKSDNNNSKPLNINQENIVKQNKPMGKGDNNNKSNHQNIYNNKKSNNQNQKNQNEKNQMKNKNTSLNNFHNKKMKNDNFFESLIKNKNNKKKNNNQKTNKHENKNRNHKGKNNYTATNNKNKKMNNKILEQNKNNQNNTVNSNNNITTIKNNNNKKKKNNNNNNNNKNNNNNNNNKQKSKRNYNATNNKNKKKNNNNKIPEQSKNNQNNTVKSNNNNSTIKNNNTKNKRKKNNNMNKNNNKNNNQKINKHENQNRKQLTKNNYNTNNMKNNTENRVQDKDYQKQNKNNNHQKEKNNKHNNNSNNLNKNNNNNNKNNKNKEKGKDVKDKHHLNKSNNNIQNMKNNNSNGMNKNKNNNDNNKKKVNNDNKNQKTNDKEEENKYYKMTVHKFILCARSELFRHFFSYYDSQSNEIKDFTENSYPFFEILIKFFYTNKIEANDLLGYENPQSILEELFDALDYYQLHENSRLRSCLIGIENYFKYYFK
ncbi:retinitis pigmentosa gtpase regulator a-related [Anaeramoeba flamelloides]|uniref:Retinitis pigmentosa gtpase regulator a-related n=1 Tax=Anaeramoeba flamelloides TaxID=1746091 RepID=A0ABQ8YBT1_9EUKA|nr:retinitis pigmentosa gtpase regulator a-related [Anaeramoeba flamelloides]